MCQLMDGLFRQEDVEACQLVLEAAHRVLDLIQGSQGSP